MQSNTLDIPNDINSNVWQTESSPNPQSPSSPIDDQQSLSDNSSNGRFSSQDSQIRHPEPIQISTTDSKSELSYAPPIYSTDLPTPLFIPPQSTQIPATQSQALSNIQSIFTDSQKIAYVGLCYLIIYGYKRTRLRNQRKPLQEFEKWSVEFLEKIYVYLDLIKAERRMIEDLAMHGVQTDDLSASLINDAKAAALSYENKEKERIQKEQEALDEGIPLPDYSSDSERPHDIRYTVLSHLFLLSISDGLYDSRARVMLKQLATFMKIEFVDIIKLESAIADQLRLYEMADVKPNEQVVGERNKIDSRNRLLFAGLATLAGGAVIGLTAGIAAPFIGAGIGAALTTFGVSGAAGVGTFMASAGGLALITTGGVLTGGGMSGVKMMKRTRGIEQFEFMGIDEAMELVEMHRAERREKQRILQKEEKSEKNISPQKQRTSKMKTAKSTEAWIRATDDGKQSEWLNAEVHESTLENTENKEESDIASSQSHSPIHENKNNISTSRQTNVIITVSGWVIHGEDDHSIPFSVLKRNIHGDQYTLIWETEVLKELGSALKILVSEVASFIVQQGIQVLILPALMAALTGPLWMLKLSYLVDNPWGNALTKAEKAGRVLADTLRGQVHGNRPVTLVGFSLGARVLYYCLLELAEKGAYGIIEDVYILGCPVLGTKSNWQLISSVVAGRVVNGYCSNDMLLGVLYRASTALWKDVAGLGPVEEVEGIESIDLKDIISGHMGYRENLPIILEKCGFLISSDHFEDEEDEEEQARLEAQQELAKINETKLREKEAKLKKKQEEFLERNRLKLIESEKKKAASELKKGKSSYSWFGTKSTPKESQSNLDIINTATDDFWQPKELKSTLPPLIITAGGSNLEMKKKSNLDIDLDEAGLNSLLSLDHTHDINSSVDSFFISEGKSRANFGAGDMIDRKTEFEYVSDSEESFKNQRMKSETSSPMDKKPFVLFDLNDDAAPPSPSFTRERIRSLTGSPTSISRDRSFGNAKTRSSTSSPIGSIKNPWE